MHGLFLKDFYKCGHRDQYPENISLIFSNFTPRKEASVFFGMKYFIINYLGEIKDALNIPAKFGRKEYDDFIFKTLGIKKKHKHIEDLIKLGYLPIAIYALPELTLVPAKVPAFVIFNTHPDFFWVPGMLETILSCTLWGGCTSATIARQYRLLLDNYAAQTSDIPEFVDYQAHDFSMRGMFGLEAAMISGMAHLQYFKGTDTIPALIADTALNNKELHIASVPATEHSVMSAGGKDNEFETIKRLIQQTYPMGIISVVSDTWNLWNVVGEFLPKLKDIIMQRDGKLVIRPDSGDPVEILCGNSPYDISKYKGVLPTLENKGLIECLWDIFGGTTNSKGYKQLDPHIGAIYGDSITLDRAKEICERLKQKGFASTNIVFGIGSYSYQYNTRDTLGWAMKATYCEINGVGKAITKDPITDNGTKKSHSGLLVVRRNAQDGSLVCDENCTWDEFYSEENQLKLIYKDGKYYGK